jgi:hypothetical protein
MVEETERMEDSSFDSGCGPAQDERLDAGCGPERPRADLKVGAYSPAPATAGRQDERGQRKRGGGPRTEAGKAVVARNATRHGVLAQTPVITLVESEEDWERLRSGIFEYLQVEGALEEALADRIAGIIWRLYRVVRFESEAINQYLRDVPRDWRSSQPLRGRKAPAEPSPEQLDEMSQMMMSRLLPGDETMNKVMRYETKFHRYLLQTLHQLMVLKGLKWGGTGRYYGIPDLDDPGLPGRAGPARAGLRRPRRHKDTRR